MTTERMPLDVWQEYDWAADWCAARGYNGQCGSPLPRNLSDRAKREIDNDPEAFAERVRACAYARAMEHMNLPEE